jgi:hypothetical protein
MAAIHRSPFTFSRSTPRLAVCAEMRDDLPVSTVAEIKEAIARLSPQEYCELMAELFPHADDEWDKQMKADFASGKMDWLTKETDAAIREGKTIPLEKM